MYFIFYLKNNRNSLSPSVSPALSLTFQLILSLNTEFYLRTKEVKMQKPGFAPLRLFFKKLQLTFLFVFPSWIDMKSALLTEHVTPVSSSLQHNQSVVGMNLKNAETSHLKWISPESRIWLLSISHPPTVHQTCGHHCLCPFSFQTSECSGLSCPLTLHWFPWRGLPQFRKPSVVPC